MPLLPHSSHLLLQVVPLPQLKKGRGEEVVKQEPSGVWLSKGEHL